MTAVRILDTDKLLRAARDFQGHLAEVADRHELTTAETVGIVAYAWAEHMAEAFAKKMGCELDVAQKAAHDAINGAADKLVALTEAETTHAN